MTALQYLALDKDPDPCTGLVFRACVSEFLDKRNSYVKTVRFTPLIRSSCRCLKCSSLFDVYIDTIREGLFPIIPDEVVDQALYSLRLINESRDFETGYVDDYDLEFFNLTLGD